MLTIPILWSFLNVYILPKAHYHAEKEIKGWGKRET